MKLASTIFLALILSVTMGTAKTDEQGELIDTEVAVRYCGDMKWKDTEYSCNQRVHYMADTHHMSHREAKLWLFEQRECICGGDGFDGNTKDDTRAFFGFVSLSVFCTLIVMKRFNRSRMCCLGWRYYKGKGFISIYALGLVFLFSQLAMLWYLIRHMMLQNSSMMDRGQLDVPEQPKIQMNKGRDRNLIQLENSMPGSSDWVLTNPALNREVEGYMSRTSVQRGQKISLFYSSQEAEQVTVEVFRTGWYNGIGGRKVLGPIDLPGLNQKMPSPGRDGLIACQWKDPYELRTEKDWTTGVYLVKMTESQSNRQSYAIFVLRDDDLGAADIMFQLPFNTYQAYNIWGGTNLYRCTVRKFCNQARKASFDRPYAAPENKLGAFGIGAGEYLSNVQPLDYQKHWKKREGEVSISSAASWNYNMVRWLERNNLSVTYVSNVDVHTRLPTLAKPKLFLTQGHDEYWSWEMRDHVTAWRDGGIHLAFLGSNTAYWQIRYEDISSLPGDQEPRTIVNYRRWKIEPNKTKYASIKFRDQRPEALMVGLEYVDPGGDPFDEDMIVYDDSHWIFNGTGVAKGDKISGMLGCKNIYLSILFLFV